MVSIDFYEQHRGSSAVIAGCVSFILGGLFTGILTTNGLHPDYVKPVLISAPILGNVLAQNYGAWV